MVTVKRLKDN